MTNPKTQQTSDAEQRELIALRRDIVAAMNRMLNHQPLSLEEANIFCGLTQAYMQLNGGAMRTS